MTAVIINGKAQPLRIDCANDNDDET